MMTCIDPAHVGKPKVHERDVRLMLSKHLNGVDAGGCLGHQKHVRLVVNDGCNPFAQQRVVINA